MYLKQLSKPISSHLLTNLLYLPDVVHPQRIALYIVVVVVVVVVCVRVCVWVWVCVCVYVRACVRACARVVSNYNGVCSRC